MALDNETAAQKAFLNKLSKQIAAHRKARGFTQERLAEETGLDRVALANIETNKRRPTVNTLFKISQALKVDVRDFFVK